MNALIANVRQWWSLRTIREQRMLGVMALLILAILIWLLIVSPLWAWRAEAASRWTQARADRALVLSAAGRLAGEQASRSGQGGDITAIVQQSAEAAGVTVTLGMDPSGGLGFSASNVSSAQLFGWLSDLKAQYSLDATRLSIVENADATLQAEGSFGP